MGAREIYFNAATPGSVAFPAAPLAGKSSLSPFRYEERDGHVVVFDVPLMDEHEDSSRRKPFNKFSGDLFDNVVRSTKDFEKQGAYCQITIGHTDEDDENEFAVPVIGHIRNVRSHGRTIGKRQIMGDMWFKVEDFDAYIRTNKFPRRSAEISRVDFRLDPLAVLGASTPARPLPDMIFEKSGDHEVYMVAHPNVGDEDMSDAVLEAIAKMSESFDKRLTAIEAFQDDKKDDDDEKKKKEKSEDDDDKDKEEDEDEKDKSNKTKGYDDDDDKDKDKDKSGSQHDKETFAELRHEVDGLSDCVKTLTAENATLRTEKITQEIDGKVVYFKRVGIDLGNDEAVEKFKKSVAKLDHQERQDRYTEIEERYTRVPCGVKIDRTDLDGGVPESSTKVSKSEEDAVIAQAFSRKHGVGQEEVFQVLKNEGQAGLAGGPERFRKERAPA